MDRNDEIIIPIDVDAEGFGKGVDDVKNMCDSLQKSVKATGNKMRKAFSDNAMANFAKSQREVASNERELGRLLDETNAKLERRRKLEKVFETSNQKTSSSQKKAKDDLSGYTEEDIARIKELEKALRNAEKGRKKYEKVCASGNATEADYKRLESYKNIEAELRNQIDFIKYLEQGESQLTKCTQEEIDKREEEYIKLNAKRQEIYENISYGDENVPEGFQSWEDVLETIIARMKDVRTEINQIKASMDGVQDDGGDEPFRGYKIAPPKSDLDIAKEELESLTKLREVTTEQLELERERLETLQAIADSHSQAIVEIEEEHASEKKAPKKEKPAKAKKREEYERNYQENLEQLKAEQVANEQAIQQSRERIKALEGQEKEYLALVDIAKQDVETEETLLELLKEEAAERAKAREAQESASGGKKRELTEYDREELERKYGPSRSEDNKKLMERVEQSLSKARDSETSGNSQLKSLVAEFDVAMDKAKDLREQLQNITPETDTSSILPAINSVKEEANDLLTRLRETVDVPIAIKGLDKVETEIKVTARSLQEMMGKLEDIESNEGYVDPSEFVATTKACEQLMTKLDTLVAKRDKLKEDSGNIINIGDTKDFENMEAGLTELAKTSKSVSGWMDGSTFEQTIRDIESALEAIEPATRKDTALMEELSETLEDLRERGKSLREEFESIEPGVDTTELVAEIQSFRDETDAALEHVRASFGTPVATIGLKKVNQEVLEITEKLHGWRDRLAEINNSGKAMSVAQYIEAEKSVSSLLARLKELHQKQVELREKPVIDDTQYKAIESELERIAGVTLNGQLKTEITSVVDLMQKLGDAKQRAFDTGDTAEYQEEIANVHDELSEILGLVQNGGVEFPDADGLVKTLETALNATEALENKVERFQEKVGEPRNKREKKPEIDAPTDTKAESIGDKIAKGFDNAVNGAKKYLVSTSDVIKAQEALESAVRQANNALQEQTKKSTDKINEVADYKADGGTDTRANVHFLPQVEAELKQIEGAIKILSSRLKEAFNKGDAEAYEQVLQQLDEKITQLDEKVKRTSTMEIPTDSYIALCDNVDMLKKKEEELQRELDRTEKFLKAQGVNPSENRQYKDVYQQLRNTKQLRERMEVKKGAMETPAKDGKRADYQPAKESVKFQKLASTLGNTKKSAEELTNAFANMKKVSDMSGFEKATKVGFESFVNGASIAQSVSVAFKTAIQGVTDAFPELAIVLRIVLPLVEELGNYMKAVAQRLIAPYQKLIATMWNLDNAVRATVDTVTQATFDTVAKSLLRAANASIRLATSLASIVANTTFRTIVAPLVPLAEALNSAANGAMRFVHSIGSSVIRKARNDITALSRKVLGLATNFLGLTKAHNTHKKGLAKSLKMLMRYGLGVRSVFTLIRKLRSALVSGFQMLAQYSDTVNESISDMMSSMSQIKYGIAAAFAPILNIVAPIISSLCDWLAQAISYLSAFIALLCGQSTYIKATKVQQDYAESLSDTGSAASDASKQLASFDDLNILKDSNSGSSGTDASDYFETVDLDSVGDWLTTLKQLIEDEDWEGIGEYIAEKINTAFSTIKELISWDAIGDIVTPYIEAFCAIFNSLVDNIDWDLIGSTLATGINTLLHIANLLLTGIDFENIGRKISEALNALIRDIEWDLLGETLGAFFNAKLNYLYGIVDEFDWAQLGDKLSTGFNSMIGVIDWDVIGKTVSSGLKGIFDALAAFIDGADIQSALEDVVTALKNVDWSGIATSFASFINTFTSKVNELTDVDVVGVVHDMVAGINKAFTSISWSDIGQMVANFFNATLDTLYTAVTTFNFSSLAQALTDGLNGFIAGVNVEELGQLMASLVDNILAFIYTAITSFDVETASSQLTTYVNSIFENIRYEAIGLDIQAGIASILDFINLTLDGFEWDVVGANLATYLNDIIARLQEMNFGETLANIFNSILGFIGSAITTFNWGDVATMLANNINGFVTGMDWEGIATTISGLINGLVEFVGNFFANTDWGTLVSNLVSTLCNAVGGIDTEKLGGAITSIAKAINDMFANIDWDEIARTVSEFVGGLLESIDMAELFDAYFNISTFASKLKRTILGSIDWVSLVQEFVNGFFEADWTKYFEGGLKNISQEIDIFFQKLVGVFAGIGDVCMDGLGGVVNSFLDWIESVVSSIKGVFVDGLAQLGSDIMQGLINGFTALWDWLCSIPQKIYDTIAGGIISFFAIGSPSKVMCELGGFIIEGLINGITALWESLVAFISGALDGFVGFFAEAWESVQTAASTAWTVITEFLTGIWEGIKEIASTVWEFIVSIITGYWETVHEVTSTVWNAITEFITGIWEGIKSIVSTVVEFIVDFVTRYWNTVKDATTTVWSAISSFVSTIWSTISGVVSTAVSKVKELVSAAWEKIKSVTTSIFNTVSSTISGAWNTISTTVTSLLTGIYNTVAKIFGNIYTAVSNKITSVYNVIKSGLTSAVSFITGLVSSATTWGKDMIQNIINGISSMISSVKDTVSNVASTISSYLHFSVPDVGPLSDADEWGGDMMDLIASGIASNTGVVTSALTSVGTEITQTVSNTWSSVYVATNEAWPEISGVVESNLSAVENAVSTSGVQIEQALSSAFSNVKLNTDSEWSSIKAVICDTLDEIDYSSGVSAESILETLSSAFEELGVDAEAYWPLIENIINTTLDSVEAEVESTATAVETTLLDTWNTVSSDTETTWDEVDAVVGRSLTSIETDVDETVNEVSEIVKNAWANIGNESNVVWPDTADAVSDALDTIERDSNVAWPEVDSVVDSTLSSITANVEQATDTVVETMSGNWARAADDADIGWPEIADVVEENLATIETDVDTSTEYIADSLSEAWDGMSTDVSDTFSSIQLTFDEGFTNIEESITTYMTAIAEYMSTGMASLTDVADTGMESVKASVQSKMEEIAITVTEGMTSVQDAMLSGWDIIITSLEEILLSLAETVTVAFESLQLSVSTGMQEIQSAMITGWDSVVVAVDTAMATISEVFATGMALMAESATSGMATVREAMSSGWDGVESIVSETFTSINKTIAAQWKVINKSTTTAMNTMSTNQTSAWKAICELVDSSYSSVENTASKAMDKINTTVSSAMSTMESSIKASFSNIGSTTTTSLNSIASTVTSGWATANTKVSDAMASMLSIVKSNMPSIATCVTNNMSTANDSITKYTKAMSSTVSSAWTEIYNTTNSKCASIVTLVSSKTSEMSNALSSGMSTMQSSASTHMNNVLTAMKGVSFNSVGKHISDGIQAGIDNNWSNLKTYIQQYCKNILTTMQNTLKIASPSKVFRDKVGFFIGEGVAVGIEQSESDVLDTVCSIADAIAEEFNNGEYSATLSITTAEITGTMYEFSSAITNSVYGLMDTLQTIADNVTFTVPVMATGSIVPYSTGTTVSGSKDIVDTIELTNDELGVVIAQSMSNAAMLIVQAIQQYSGTTVNFDGAEVTTQVVNEINRRTRITGNSPLLY